MGFHRSCRSFSENLEHLEAFRVQISERHPDLGQEGVQEDMEPLGLRAFQKALQRLDRACLTPIVEGEYLYYSSEIGVLNGLESAPEAPKGLAFADPAGGQLLQVPLALESWPHELPGRPADAAGLGAGDYHREQALRGRQRGERQGL